ncbi:MAG: hypothetical protein JO362_15920 [Streptomycetaceae bacterium]|nr:hypothetical protein [Streptomycetaceae bacterium]
MAKNKNQKQERRPQQPMESRSAEVRSSEQTKSAPMPPQQEMLSAGTSSTAKKKQKKLGHN